MKTTAGAPLANKYVARTEVLPIQNKKAELSQDDRAMRPMYGCPKKFRESLTTPTATFSENF